jgi:uncharacterized membrane protein YkvA (DUF1232 family)
MIFKKILKKYEHWQNEAEQNGDALRQQITSQFQQKLDDSKGMLHKNKKKWQSIYQLYQSSKISKETKIWLAAVLIYFIIPTDVIFDYMPLVGYADDLALLAFVLKKITKKKDNP